MRIISDLKDMTMHPEMSEEIQRDPLRFEKVEPSEKEVEAMAKRLYMAFCKSMFPLEPESEWMRVTELEWKLIKDKDVEPQDSYSYSKAYQSWLAVAKEALK